MIDQTADGLVLHQSINRSIHFHPSVIDGASSLPSEELCHELRHGLPLPQQLLSILIDDRHCQQDARATPSRPHEIAQHRQGSDRHASQPRSRGDVPVKHRLHGLDGPLLVLLDLVFLHRPCEHDRLLLAQMLLGDLLRRSARDHDPQAGEQGADGQHVHDVKHGAERIHHHFLDVTRSRNVVRHASGWARPACRASLVGPYPEQTHERVVGHAPEHELGEEEQVCHESPLQDDGHVGGVEETDAERFRVLHGPLLLDYVSRDRDPPALQPHDQEEYDCGRKDRRQVGEMRPEECHVEGLQLIGPGPEEMHHRDEGPVDLRAVADIDGLWREEVPHDVLAGAGGNE